MLLYLAAYTTNLLATPTDDALAAAARADPGFARASPLPGGLDAALRGWHALHGLRMAAAGAAWALVCYRSNPYLMLRVHAARQLQQQLAGPGGGGDQPGAAAVVGDGSGAVAQASWAVERRLLPSNGGRGGPTCAMGGRLAA